MESRWKAKCKVELNRYLYSELKFKMASRREPSEFVYTGIIVTKF